MGGANSKKKKTRTRKISNGLRPVTQTFQNISYEQRPTYSENGNCYATNSSAHRPRYSENDNCHTTISYLSTSGLSANGRQVSQNLWCSTVGNTERYTQDQQSDMYYNRPNISSANRNSNKGSITPNSVNGHFENRRYARGLRRCNSLDYDPRNNQHYSPLYLQPQIRSNSLNKVGGGYGESRRGGIKRHSWDGEPSADFSYRGDRGSQINFDELDYSYVGPQVKRRSSYNEEINYSLASGSESEISVFGELDTYDDDQNDFTDDNVDIQSFGQSYEPFDVLDILSFPSEWSSYAVNKTGFVDISFSSPEGQSVMKFFHRTSRTKDFKLQITNITRIESPFLHTLYMLKKEELAARNGHVDEVFLFHGTKKENLANICENNLDWRMHSNSHRFGQGVSFSPIATYSSHYCDNNSVIKVMLLFKVLISNATIGTDNMTIPPDENKIIFDASIKEDTKVIVKYTDNEFYPLYKILFTKHSA